MRVDLHVHTRHSPDSLTNLEDVVRWARRARLDALAITDHDTIEGALALKALSNFPIIVGEEISTNQGDVCGLFLQERIAPGQMAAETMRQIHEQGGIVYVPHPQDRLRRSALRRETLLPLLDHIDIVEVLNARVLLPLDNERADALALEHNIFRGAGSDAHHGIEIGCAYVEMPPFHDAPGFLQSMAQAKVCGRRSFPLVRLSSVYARVVKAIERFP
ncbi:MAG: PHP domain-containing protein [Anaerolineales bacterium]